MLQLSALLLYLSTIISACAWHQAGGGSFVGVAHLALIFVCAALWVMGEMKESD